MHSHKCMSSSPIVISDLFEFLINAVSVSHTKLFAYNNVVHLSNKYNNKHIFYQFLRELGSRELNHIINEISEKKSIFNLFNSS